MAIFINFLYILEVIICFLMGGVILLQKPKGGGLGGSFGGGMGEAVFGAQMGNVLTKVTIILASLFLLNTIALSRLTSGSGKSLMEGVRTEAPANTDALPNFPGTAGNSGSVPAQPPAMPPADQ